MVIERDRPSLPKNKGGGAFFVPPDLSTSYNRSSRLSYPHPWTTHRLHNSPEQILGYIYLKIVLMTGLVDKEPDRNTKPKLYISAKEVDRKNTRRFFNLHGLTLRDALGQVKPCGTSLTSEVKQKAGISDDDDETKVELCQDIADLRPVNPNRTRVKVELLNTGKRTLRELQSFHPQYYNFAHDKVILIGLCGVCEDPLDPRRITKWVVAMSVEWLFCSKAV
ncbi:hypothetical protein PHLCEN_2v2281 [Hermanssonia centrifuga]|uniref:Uncharacterized protein n=1 Tax=Hermanssonia centrifuga TaxID=98765 RepID=A0A2R6RPK1_9APHY|nr:hypothetical protein PHLCEN_2v2281 [Hermanssonia centrifuga]